MNQHDAIRQCKKNAQGHDFFVQQHSGAAGYTVCGIFNEALDSSDHVVTHGHKYGSVCYKQALYP